LKFKNFNQRGFLCGIEIFLFAYNGVGFDVHAVPLRRHYIKAFAGGSYNFI